MSVRLTCYPIIQPPQTHSRMHTVPGTHLLHSLRSVARTTLRGDEALGQCREVNRRRHRHRPDPAADPDNPTTEKTCTLVSWKLRAARAYAEIALRSIW